MARFYSMEKELRRFERERWGTNDMPEIQEKIRQEEWSRAQDSLTGMEEEQADWEAEE